ncbi:hypothetical protein M011DRAFT_180107 [Sporormia fimetaria CBS 119925]|uniref:Uncharacterized protein n=1 Tax=Sporormia fimetaria CBS 119925 TaxID=1340428 RepID=A0A6A6VMA3_9PLEO|nr:hypothetical protein M011DRAFT_180107 [Sporormia fimetaria CBS 119925]
MPCARGCTVAPLSSRPRHSTVDTTAAAIWSYCCLLGVSHSYNQPYHDTSKTSDYPLITEQSTTSTRLEIQWLRELEHSIYKPSASRLHIPHARQGLLVSAP